MCNAVLFRFVYDLESLVGILTSIFGCDNKSSIISSFPLYTALCNAVSDTFFDLLRMLTSIFGWDNKSLTISVSLLSTAICNAALDISMSSLGLI